MVNDSLTKVLKHFNLFFIFINYFDYLDYFDTKIMTKIMEINFISNIVSKLWSSLKRLKVFDYLKERIFLNSVVLLQKTLFWTKDEIKWKGEFKGELYFSFFQY